MTNPVETIEIVRTGKPLLSFVGSVVGSGTSKSLLTTAQKLFYTIKLYAVDQSDMMVARIYFAQRKEDSIDDVDVLYSMAVVNTRDKIKTSLEAWWLPQPVLSWLPEWHGCAAVTEQRLRFIYLATLTQLYGNCNHLFDETV